MENKCTLINNKFLNFIFALCAALKESSVQSANAMSSGKLEKYIPIVHILLFSPTA